MISWLAKEEHGSVLLLRPKTLRGPGHAEAQALLRCPAGDVLARGQALFSWLQQATSEDKGRVLDALANDLTASLLEPTRKDNHLAALEILARHNHPEAWRITLDWLNQRPISEAHLDLASLPTIGDLHDDATKLALARALAATLSEPPPALSMSLPVEVFRTLERIAPIIAVSRPLCDTLARPMALEETAVWNAVAGAAAQLRREHDWSSLGAIVKARWDALMTHPDPEDVDNFPGLVACILEIAGRCGVAWDPLMDEVLRHSTKSWNILYQLAQRPLDFLDDGRRSAVYVMTLRALLDRGFSRAYAAILKRFADDLPDACEVFLQGSASSAGKEAPRADS